MMEIILSVSEVGDRICCELQHDKYIVTDILTSL